MGRMLIPVALIALTSVVAVSTDDVLKQADAAYAEHQEKTLGSLETGKWADFIVVDRDLFKVAPTDIWKIQVLETWVAGERVYAKGEQSAQR